MTRLISFCTTAKKPVNSAVLPPTTRINDKAKEYGIENSIFHIYFYYAAQCALSLEQKTLTALSKLDFVNIDCIKLYDKYETKQSGDEETIWFYSDGKLEKEVTVKIGV